jgi:Flp pilus assembly protein CpaB
MEMEFKEGGKHRRLLIVVGVMLAIFAFGAAYYLSFSSGAKGSETPKKTVVVAVHDIPARTTIASDALTLRDMPDDPSLTNAYTDPTALVGFISGVTIYANQPILPNLLATSAAGADFSILDPTEPVTADSPYWRAVALSIPAERAVGGRIAVDQHVDVFATVDVKVFTPGDDGTLTEGITKAGHYSDKSTKVVFTDVQVLAKSEDGGLYVVKVDEATAEEIAHLQASGAALFSLALRPEQDNREVDPSKYGTTTGEVVQKHEFPIPQAIPVP